MGSDITDLQILETASTMFHTRGQEVFEERRPGFFEIFTAVIPTSVKTNEVDLLGAMPVVRQWKGEKEMASMRAYQHSATLVPYEASFRLDFMDLRYDGTGLLGRRVNAFFSSRGSGGMFYDKLATDKLLENPVGYDGVAIFSASHPHGPDGSTQSNVTASAFSAANHAAIMEAGQTRRFENGEPMHIAFDTLMVGPSNEDEAKQVTQSDERIVTVDATGAEATSSVVAAATIPNVYGGGDVTLIVNPRLTGAHAAKYFYFDSAGGVKPIVCYEGRTPEPHDQTEMDGEGRFMKNELRFSLEADQAYTAGMWQGSHAGLP